MGFSSLDYNLNGQVPKGEDRGEGLLRLRSAGLIQEDEETIHNEDHRHLQDGRQADRGSTQLGAATQDHALPLCRHLPRVLHGEDVSFGPLRCLCIVMDYCEGGDMFHKIARQK